MGRAMKNSGIPWLGEIPENWETSILKYSIKWKSEKGAPDETVLSLYREYGVIPKDSRDDNHNVTSLDTSGYKVVDVGDLVINKMKAWQGSMAVSDYRGIVSPAYHVCTITNPQIYKRYLHHLLRNPAYVPEYLRLSTGMRIGQWDLGFDDFKQIPFILPPLEEQKRIAYYIDNNLGSINSVIEKTQESIEEYKRMKQAVITQAVTKGVRGDRPMKNSGIEWIGEIADNYCVHKLKFLLKQPLQYGANEMGVPFEETLPRYIRITDITLDGELKETGKQSLPEDVAKEFLLKDGDVLFARSGATVGKTFLYKSSYGRAAYAGYLIRASLNDGVIPDFLFFYTQSSIYEEWKNQIFIQSTIQNIGADRYSLLPVILPPMDEQLEIAAYLDAKCSEIDALIAQKEQLLTELGNYKKSLIYEYVTGKKELPSQEGLTSETIDPKVLLMVYIAEYFAPKGRVHMQKMIYSVECILGLPFGTQYYRYPHGPYDQNIEKYEQEAVYRGWLSVTTGNQVEYSIGKNVDEYKKAYQEVFGDVAEDICRICTFLSKMKTSQTERVATLLASWNDFILKGIDSPTDDQIIDDVRNHWSDNKHNSPESTWQGTLDKIRSNGFTPKGNGLCTKS